MKSFPNIEKSAFRKGEYIGYGEGYVWHIQRFTSELWRAEAREGAEHEEYTPRILGHTLAAISDQLEALTRRKSGA